MGRLVRCLLAVAAALVVISPGALGVNPAPAHRWARDYHYQQLWFEQPDGTEVFLGVRMTLEADGTAVATALASRVGDAWSPVERGGLTSVTGFGVPVRFVLPGYEGPVPGRWTIDGNAVLVEFRRMQRGPCTVVLRRDPATGSVAALRGDLDQIIEGREANPTAVVWLTRTPARERRASPVEDGAPRLLAANGGGA